MLNYTHTEPPTAITLKKPAERPPLWLSSGKEAGKGIVPYSLVHSTQVQNKLMVGSMGQVNPSAEHDARRQEKQRQSMFQLCSMLRQ